jgi:hypothetical protein
MVMSSLSITMLFFLIVLTQEPVWAPAWSRARLTNLMVTSSLSITMLFPHLMVSTSSLSITMLFSFIVLKSSCVRKVLGDLFIQKDSVRSEV